MWIWKSLSFFLKKFSICITHYVKELIGITYHCLAIFLAFFKREAVPISQGISSKKSGIPILLYLTKCGRLPDF